MEWRFNAGVFPHDPLLGIDFPSSFIAKSRPVRSIHFHARWKRFIKQFGEFIELFYWKT